MREAGDRTTWTEPDAAYEDAVHAAVDACLRRPGASAAVLDDLLGRRRRPGLVQRPGRQAGRADRARRARRLPGQRAVGAEPGRPRQPAARSTSTSARGAARRARRRRPARRSPAASTTPAPPSCSSPGPRSALRRDRPELFDGLRAARAPTGRPPTTCSPSTAAARSPSPPGCRVGLAARGGWGDTSLAAAAGRVGATRSTGRAGRRPARCCSPTCSAAPGGAAASADRPRTRRSRRTVASTCGRRVPERGALRRRGRPTSCRWSAAPTTGGPPAGPGLPERRGRLRLPRRRRPDAAARPAVAAAARRACTSCRARSTRRRTPGPTTPGPGRQLAGSVIYELHVGTFTPEGTFDAALGRLDHLSRARRRPRRAAAGQRVQRRAQLGLRRRALVRRPRAVRRPGGATSASSTAATRPGSA